MTSMPPSLAPDDLKRRLDRGERLVLVDVREPAEFEGWHIEGALNVPLARLQDEAEAIGRRQAPVVAICAFGMRSQKARDALRAQGIEASNLEGGMVAWNSVYDLARVPTAGADLAVLQVRRVGKGCLSYVLASAGEAVVIDPTLDTRAFVDAAAGLGARIVRVLDTHAHADHASGGRDLARETGARYEGPEELGPSDGVLRDGDVVKFGHASLRVRHTPGHTPGLLSYEVDGLLFCGDTLFLESVGRPDLGQDARANAGVLYDTLHERILSLAPTTRVLPGHWGDAVRLKTGEPLAATLDELRARLPALSKPKDAFVDWIASSVMPKPGNFETIKKRNRGLVQIDDLDDLRELEAGPNRCAVSK